MNLTELGVNNFGDWLRAGGILGILALVVKFYLENRKLRLQEKGDDRDGFGALIQALTKDVAQVREQYRQCEAEHARTRQELDGLRRQFVTYQLAVAQAVPPSRRTPEIEAMMTTLEKRQDDGGGM